MAAHHPDTQVVIVGAGMAGLCAAWALERQGVDAVVLDRTASRSPCFRAEKIEPFQSRLLRKIELLDARRPLAGPIERILLRRGDRIDRVEVGEQYGIRYHETVNELRRRVGTRVPVRKARVTAIEPGEVVQRVELEGGETLRARLVILATGGSGGLAESVGYVRMAPDPPMRTLSFGFDLARTDGAPFPFRGFNHRAPDPASGIEFLTLFRVGSAMRANLFTLWKPSDPRVRPVKEDPVGALERFFPGIRDHTGPLEVRGRVEVCPTTYYRLTRVERAGVVAVGEEFQSVSPASGTGLDKVLADVDLLCHRYVPRWMDSRGMGASKTARFYADPEKRRVDERARAEWVHAWNRRTRPRTAKVRRIAWRLVHRSPY